MRKVEMDVIDKKRKECEQVMEEEGIEKRGMFFSFSLEEHNGATLRNLVHLIYSRCALLNKATEGNFRVEEELIQALKDDSWTYSKTNFLNMLFQFESLHGKSLFGLKMDKEKICFTGFGRTQDRERLTAQGYLAVLMNEQALNQKRIQAKQVNDGDEKYAMRIWLNHIGMVGSEFKKTRAILMKNFRGCVTEDGQRKSMQKSVVANSSSEKEDIYELEKLDGNQELHEKSFQQKPYRYEKPRAAAYIRVSTDTADQENSFETQERYFRHLLSENKTWTFAGVYSDYGLSGTSEQRRTGFKRILRHCQEGKIDHIITKSISRFARNTADFMTALQTMQEAGVTIHFEKEGLNTGDAASDFILTTLAAIAQEESRSISANINWGNQKRFPRGDVPNRDIYGYRFTGEYKTAKSGYRYRTVEIVEEEAAIVRWIFQSYVGGRTLKDMARDLNRRHIPHKLSPYAKKRMERSAKGQLNAGLDEGWTSGQIREILKSERYTGDVLVQKTFTEDYLTHKVKKNRGEAAQYWVRDHHPAIISRELFAEAKKVREIGNGIGIHHDNRKRYDFSGRLICGICGRFYHVRNANNHPIWFCPSAARNNGRSICHGEKVYEEQIVRMFRRAVSERYRLTVIPMPDPVQVGDMIRGRFPFGVEQTGSTFRKADEFVGQMLIRFENIQKMDTVERDRAFLKRRIAMAKDSKERACRREKFLRTRKEALEIRSLLLKDDAMIGEELLQVTEKLKEEKEKQEEAACQEKKLRERLDYMESYWEELERNYEYREKALEWMRGLPRGKAGTVAFLNGLTGIYVKAFALSIIIHDPLHYTVHWFDDTKTKVEMDTNIEDYRLQHLFQ